MLGALPAGAGAKSAAMVIDANSGRVLHNQAGDERRHPASLTKMMTIYLTFELIEAGRLSPASKLTVSERAASVSPSKLDLKPGDQISVLNAVKALIVKSANDVAVALAEKIAGSEPAFAALMTKRARQLGMTSTVFKNASGLPDADQVTTARDMLTLAMRLQDDFPRHYALFSTQRFSWGGKTYRTHNTLMGRFPGMDGIKTGYTQASGFNLVSSVRANGKHVVGAVLGGASASVRNAHMRTLMFTALDSASRERTRQAGPQLIAKVQPAKRPEKAKAAAKAVTAAAAKSVPSPVSAKRADVKPNPLVVPAEPAPAPQVGVTPITVGPPEIEARESVAPEAPAPVAAAAIPKLDFSALRATLRAARDEHAQLPRGETQQAPPADAPARATETIAVKSKVGALIAGRRPSTLDQQLASLEPASGAPGVDGSALPDAEAQPVRFEPMTAPSGLGGPVSEQPAYDIQIGSFSTAEDAERTMKAAKASTGGVLDGHAPMALPAVSGGVNLYRARFAGFDAKKASAACLELRRLQFDCFVAPSN